MTQAEKDKLAAAGNIAVGAARMAGGAATALGLGVVGGFLRHHHLMHVAKHLGKMSIESGKRQYDAGHAQWRETNS